MGVLWNITSLHSPENYGINFVFSLSVAKLDGYEENKRFCSFTSSPIKLKGEKNMNKKI